MAERHQVFFSDKQPSGENRSLRLGYRLLLWFEGAKAFNRLPGVPESGDLEDIYYLESAFTTDGDPRVTIAGVANIPVKSWDRIKAPLEDDFAVLKVDHVPKGLIPIPS